MDAGMGVSWARVGLLALVLAVALPAATVFAQKGGEAGPIPERSTTCWPCHKDWSPPLKTFFNILPPPQAGAAPGQTFDYVVQVQGAWTPAKDGPNIVYHETTLDLTGAPSLTFFSQTAPSDDTYAGTITPDPQDPTATQSASQAIAVPVGTTDMTITLEPQDASSTTGPDLDLNVYAGTSTPQGNPAFTSRAAGRGGTETVTLAKDQFRGAGYGNWSVEATYTPVRAPDPAALDPGSLVGAPNLQDVPFTIKVHMETKDTGERVQVQPIRETIPKGGSALVRFHLRADTQSGPGEVVRLTVNTTEFYDHDDAGTDNFANVTKAYPTDIPVSFDGQRDLIGGSDTGPDTVVGGGVQNGATLDTVSESVGYGSALLLISSVWTGGMFGKASRRQLNSVFGTAKRRVAFHNFLSYGIMLFAAVHTVLFIVETNFYWTLGVLWGGLAILSMLLLGVTGAWQVQMIRRWSYGFWRWSHYGLAVAAIAFTLVHMGLDGVHFAFIQERLGWDDPLDPRHTGWIRVLAPWPA